MNTILKLSDAEYFCSWSSTAFHDASRVSLQMKQMELELTNVSVLKQVPTYHYEDGSVTLNEDPELQLETILFNRQCLENISQYSSFNDLALQIAQRNAVSYVSHVTAYLDLSDKYKKSKVVLDESSAKYLVNLARPKQIFDAVISLGAWCQIGIMQYQRGLQIIDSPFFGFGFYQWERLMDVLDQNFKNYWMKENMVFGRTTDLFSHKYQDTRQIYHVYDNYYNMFSGHHFDACDCNEDKFKPYEEFKRRLNEKIKVFRSQCATLGNVVFALKIMNKKQETTDISEDKILRLIQILNKHRNGKPYQLRLSVPKELLQDMENIVFKYNLKQIKIIEWNTQWNHYAYDVEWENMFGDIILSYKI
ncbi:Putative_papain-like cysteine peptidase (DUF1796) [Hexamita inflata]|uniref:Papain-like cysteine peptidase (DUF1796) n=1 Tax=Hexamita inflata TaxID=28002 RepID=A0AA86Q8W5_9EUKA|nr:Putative papain-like cysteine peptidase (DUF1796) [Hexamita inflata]CAI9953453.1 Putative papain-like cysteine peptidase (DUF1796) [Hexamita inflata]